MNDIKYYAVNSLPSEESTNIGSIYFTKEGKQFIINSDKSKTKVTDIVFLDSMDENTNGSEGKIYIFASDIFKFENNTFVQITKDQESNVYYRLDINGSFESVEEMNSFDKELVVDKGVYIISGLSNGSNEIDISDIYKYSSETQEFKYLGNLRGDVGLQGFKGESGNRGIKGEIGFTGKKGAKGEIGDTGIKGKTGLKGDTGEKGETGDEGQRGSKGAIGETGLKGETGETGNKGEQGDRGEKGESFKISMSYNSIIDMNNDFFNNEVPFGAYVIISSDNPDEDEDNSQIFVKEEGGFRFQSVLRGLKGETGDRGERGLIGETGIKGNDGATGAQGIKGEIGDRGAGVLVKGTVPSEGFLPRAAGYVNGDAFWVLNKNALYVYSDSPLEAVEPTWIIGSLLKGEKGDKGAQGLRGLKGRDVEDIGDAVLLTRDQTIKGAINEALGQGKTAKRDVVNSILQKDSSVTISESDNWNDVASALSSLRSGYKVNGTDYSDSFALESVAEGDILMLKQAESLGSKKLGINFTLVGFRRSDYVALSDGRVLVIHPKDPSTSISRGVDISLIRKDGDKIVVLDTKQVDGVQESGFYPKIERLTDAISVVAVSSSSAQTPLYRTVLKRINVTNDTITVSNYQIIDAIANTAYSVAMKRISDTKFLLARRLSEGFSVGVIELNGNNNTVGNVFINHSNNITRSPSSLENLELFTISESERRYGIVGESGTAYSNGNGSIVFNEFTANENLTRLTFARSNSVHVVNFNGAFNVSYLEGTFNGRGCMYVLGRDTANGNKLIMLRIGFNATLGEVGYYFRFPIGNSANSSGGTATNGDRRNLIHSMEYYSENKILVVFDDGGTKLSSGIFDLSEATPSGVNVNLKSKGEIVGSASKLRPLLLKFKDREFGLMTLANGNASTSYTVSALNPVSGYSKYKGGYNTKKLGVALNTVDAASSNLNVRANE